MGPIWGRQDPGGPHVGRMNLARWNVIQSYFTGSKFFNPRKWMNPDDYDK